MLLTSLFSGIGGFELAFKKARIESELIVELDAAATAVLKKQFPDADFRENVLDLADIPASTTVLTAGFPCQNLSMVGDKSGIHGPKSRVVGKLFELIASSKVPIVVIENVYFMLQLDSGKAMDYIVGEFERLGYSWAYRVLDTMGFGLPQRRRRVYFVASNTLDPRGVLFADEQPPTEPPTADLSRPLGFYWTEGQSGIGLTVDGIPPLKVGSAWGIPSAPAVLFTDGEVLMPGIVACEQLQGFPAGWTAAATEDRSKKNPRWRLVGNAVSVPVAHWVAERIKAPGTPAEFPPVPSGRRRPWPDAAWNVGAGRVDVIASDRPIAVPPPSISDFRDSTWTRLSDRALDGFIGRVKKGGLRVPNGFVQALRTAVRKTTSRRDDEAELANTPVGYS